MQGEKLLTENEVIDCLEKWLNENSWSEIKCKRDSDRGIDLEAQLGNRRIIIEAKGAKANDKSKIKKREKFDSGQIHNHFGEALVKIFRKMYRHKEDNEIEYGIAQPYNLRETLLYAIGPIKKLNIKLYWVTQTGPLRLNC